MSRTIESVRTYWPVSMSHSWRFTPRMMMGWPLTRILPSFVSTLRKPTRHGTTSVVFPDASFSVRTSV